MFDHENVGILCLTIGFLAMTMLFHKTIISGLFIFKILKFKI